MEKLMEDHAFYILNDCAMTKVAYSVETDIDFSICSDSLSAIINWHALSSLGDSDHCPIVLTVMRRRMTGEQPAANWNYKRAQWERFAKSPVWDGFSDHAADLRIEECVPEIYNRMIAAAEESIPKARFNKFYPKPWWTLDLKQSRDKRERLYQAYRRNQSARNLILWQASRREHKRKVKGSKNQCWKEFVKKLNVNTPTANVFEIIRRIKGRQPRRVAVLHSEGEYFTTVGQIAGKMAGFFADVSSDQSYALEFQERRPYAKDL